MHRNARATDGCSVDEVRAMSHGQQVSSGYGEGSRRRDDHQGIVTIWEREGVGFEVIEERHDYVLRKFIHSTRSKIRG